MQAGFTLAHPIFIIVAAGTLVCVFLRGAAHKFFDFTWFSHILAEYRILPGTIAVPSAVLLTAIEVAVAFGLVVPQTRPVAAFAAAVLLLIYAAAMAANAFAGSAGTLEPVAPTHVISANTAPGVACFPHRSSNSTSSFTRGRAVSGPGR